MPDPAADSGHAAVTVSRKHENVIIFVVDVVNGSMYDGFRMIPVSGIRILPVLPVLLYFISSYEDRGGVRIRISILILTFFDSCFYSRSRDQKTIRSKKMANCNIKPLGDRVLLEIKESADEMKGGILIPDTAKEKPQEYTVIALGTGKLDDNGKKIPFDVKVGDVVLTSRYGGTEVKVDGKEYKVVNSEDILAIVG